MVPARPQRQLKDEAEQALSGGDEIISQTSSLCGDADDIYDTVSLLADHNILDEVNICQAKQQSEKVCC